MKFETMPDFVTAEAAGLMERLTPEYLQEVGCSGYACKRISQAKSQFTRDLLNGKSPIRQIEILSEECSKWEDLHPFAAEFTQLLPRRVDEDEEEEDDDDEEDEVDSTPGPEEPAAVSQKAAKARPQPRQPEPAAGDASPSQGAAGTDEPVDNDPGATTPVESPSPAPAGANDEPRFTVPAGAETALVVPPAAEATAPTPVPPPVPPPEQAVAPPAVPPTGPSPRTLSDPPSAAVVDALERDLAEMVAQEGQHDWALSELKLKIGQRMAKDLGPHGSAGLAYGKKVVPELAKRLKTAATELYRCWNFGTTFTSIAEFKAQHPDCGPAWRQVRDRLVDPEKLITEILSQAAKLSLDDRQVLLQRLTDLGQTPTAPARATAEPEAANVA